MPAGLARTTSTPTSISRILSGARASSTLDAGFGGIANSLATLNTSTLVVQNPASASTTASPNAIRLPVRQVEIGMSWINYNQIMENASDGNVTLGAGTTVLTRDTFYNNLTIPNGSILDPNGYYVFVKGNLTQQATVKLLAMEITAGMELISVTVTAERRSAGAALITNTLFGGNAGVTGVWRNSNERR